MPASPSAPTIGECLLHRRLEARARRVELVVTALEEQRRVREVAGFVPEPLRLAIRDFRLELLELHGRLAFEDDDRGRQALATT